PPPPGGRPAGDGELPALPGLAGAARVDLRRAPARFPANCQPVGSRRSSGTPNLNIMTTVSWLKPLKFEAERTIARHTVQVGGSNYAFCLAAPGDLSRRTIGEALAGAVAELRAVDAAFSPSRRRSLVSLVRR